MLNPELILTIEFNLSDGFQSSYSLSSVTMEPHHSLKKLRIALKSSSKC